MKVSIYSFSYNEEILIPYFIRHYRHFIPSCDITIYDNESTDNSVKIAKSLGCNVESYKSNNIINDLILINLKNNCWKKSQNEWVIVCDIDEWLCITEKQLLNENNVGNTILKTEGYNIVDNSKRIDLSDIDIHNTYFGSRDYYSDKNICFKLSSITDINYNVGAHKCKPNGIIKYGSTYLIKHMTYLGYPFRRKRVIERYRRSHAMRKLNYATHYSQDEIEIRKNFLKQQQNRIDLRSKFCNITF